MLCFFCFTLHIPFSLPKQCKVSKVEVSKYIKTFQGAVHSKFAALGIVNK